MTISVGVLVSVIIFFLGVMLFLMAFFTKKTAKTKSIELEEITMDMVQEIEKSTEESIKKLEKVKEEIENKLNELTEKEEKMEKMYQKVMKQAPINEKKIVPKLSSMEDKKLEIYRLYQEGNSPEKISQMVKIHKGVVETILNLQEYAKETN